MGYEEDCDNILVIKKMPRLIPLKYGILIFQETLEDSFQNCKTMNKLAISVIINVILGVVTLATIVSSNNTDDVMELYVEYYCAQTEFDEAEAEVQKMLDANVPNEELFKSDTYFNYRVKTARLEQAKSNINY